MLQKGYEMNKKETQLEIMQNRLDRGFYLFQKEYEDKVQPIMELN